MVQAKHIISTFRAIKQSMQHHNSTNNNKRTADFREVIVRTVNDSKIPENINPQKRHFFHSPYAIHVGHSREYDQERHIGSDLNAI